MFLKNAFLAILYLWCISTILAMEELEEEKISSRDTLQNLDLEYYSLDLNFDFFPSYFTKLKINLTKA